MAYCKLNNKFIALCQKLNQAYLNLTLITYYSIVSKNLSKEDLPCFFSSLSLLSYPLQLSLIMLSAVMS